MNWNGVMPAMTTAFHPDLSIDHAFVARHAQWLIENGCTGIICLGSLAEASTLTFQEKIDVLLTVVKALDGTAPVVSAVSALSTAEAVAIAKAAHQAGCSGLMILPQYVYNGDWRENKAHVAAVLNATPLPAMLYIDRQCYFWIFAGSECDEHRVIHCAWLILDSSSLSANHHILQTSKPLSCTCFHHILHGIGRNFKIGRVDGCGVFT